MTYDPHSARVKTLLASVESEPQRQAPSWHGMAKKAFKIAAAGTVAVGLVAGAIAGNTAYDDYAHITQTCTVAEVSAALVTARGPATIIPTGKSVITIPGRVLTSYVTPLIKTKECGDLDISAQVPEQDVQTITSSNPGDRIQVQIKRNLFDSNRRIEGLQNHWASAQTVPPASTGTKTGNASLPLFLYTLGAR